MFTVLINSSNLEELHGCQSLGYILLLKFLIDIRVVLVEISLQGWNSSVHVQLKFWARYKHLCYLLNICAVREGLHRTELVKWHQFLSQVPVWNKKLQSDISTNMTSEEEEEKKMENSQNTRKRDYSTIMFLFYSKENYTWTKDVCTCTTCLTWQCFLHALVGEFYPSGLQSWPGHSSRTFSPAHGFLLSLDGHQFPPIYCWLWQESSVLQIYCG